MEMFSNIDVLLNMPMEQALGDLPIAEDIREALLGKENVFKYVSKLILAYEKADWEEFDNYARLLDIKEDNIPGMYTEALEWSAKLMQN